MLRMDRSKENLSAAAALARAWARSRSTSCGVGGGFGFSGPGGLSLSWAWGLAGSCAWRNGTIAIVSRTRPARRLTILAKRLAENSQRPGAVAELLEADA